MVNRDFGKNRVEYGRKSLIVEQMLSNPIEQFRQWMGEAEDAEVKEPNTMTLATVGHHGQPTIRVMLLKGIFKEGLIFYTNFRSRKGREMDETPKAAVNFYWQDLERQVRFDGGISKIPEEQSDQYFQTRPKGSQLGAWVSQQSETIPSRQFLEEQLKLYQNKFKDQTIPRPPHWGGYLLVPSQVEFWQGGLHRLHDRIQYTIGKGGWEHQRLAP